MNATAFQYPHPVRFFELESQRQKLRMACLDVAPEKHAAMIPPRTVDDWYRQELGQTPEKIREYQRTACYAGDWKPGYAEYTRLLEGWTRHPEYWRVAWDAGVGHVPHVEAFPAFEKALLEFMGEAR